MVQINWTIAARSDLRSIAIYISKDSKNYAKIQVIRLKNRVDILNHYPLTGNVVPEFNRPKLRQLIEGNYRIIYKIVNDNRIDILTVHHSARDLINRRIIS